MKENKVNTGKDKILIADDETPILEGLKAMLEEEQYDVTTAISGIEALDIAKADNYNNE